MRYVIGQRQGKSYAFLYDDEGRRVYFRPCSSFSSDIKRVPMTRYSDIAKLKLLGFRFEEFNNTFVSYVCRYIVDEVLYVAISLSVQYYSRECRLSLITLIDDHESLSAKDNIYGFSSLFTDRVDLVIPSEMLDYILHLKSEHDFDGIMQAFDGLLGVNLYKIIVFDSDEIVLNSAGTSNVVLDIWYD